MMETDIWYLFYRNLCVVAWTTLALLILSAMYTARCMG